MPVTANSSLADVCFVVCTALDRAGITAVLSGGSAATMYAPNSYQSKDADFIITLHSTGGAGVLNELGYVADGGGTYKHAHNEFTVDFPAGPLAVGDDLIRTWETLRRDDELLHILSRTDCIRDRLMWFYHSNDRSALAAAVAVTQSGDFELDRIREWSAREGFKESFQTFASLI